MSGGTELLMGIPLFVPTMLLVGAIKPTVVNGLAMTRATRLLLKPTSCVAALAASEIRLGDSWSK